MGEQASASKSASQLWHEIREAEVVPGTISCWWLYQAGLACKAPDGAVLLVDPYLSDAVTRSYGLARAVPAPLDPAEVEVDAVLASHAHEDHLDPDAIEPFASHPRTRFVGPPTAMAKVTAKGVDRSRTTALVPGDEIEVGGLTVRAVHARHVFALEPAEDAIGYRISHGDVSVYHSGDTVYDSDIVPDTLGVTASFIAINGTAGNMNAHEAAMLAWRQGAKVAFPFHYGLWQDADYGEGATLDPGAFSDTLARLGGDGTSQVLRVGERVVIGPEGVRP
ncbi:MAG: Zn-dependent hydrolase of the beta-lactamase fold-like protein [Acidimicrobiaceae bacterium]|nr:Zn-dependent hydrolase of the beta-lactamase fold-like protein [Acidimicrobiaceae bacterium]